MSLDGMMMGVPTAPQHFGLNVVASPGPRGPPATDAGIGIIGRGLCLGGGYVYQSSDLAVAEVAQSSAWWESGSSSPDTLSETPDSEFHRSITPSSSVYDGHGDEVQADAGDAVLNAIYNVNPLLCHDLQCVADSVAGGRGPPSHSSTLLFEHAFADDWRDSLVGTATPAPRGPPGLPGVAAQLTFPHLPQRGLVSDTLPGVGDSRSEAAPPETPYRTPRRTKRPPKPLIKSEVVDDPTATRVSLQHHHQRKGAKRKEGAKRKVIKQEPSTAMQFALDAVAYGAGAAPRGSQSRTKTTEDVRDELDATVYSMFPMWTLRLNRGDFKEWRASAGLRDLTHKEQTRLSEIRRTLLARLYAERTRQRKKRQSANHKTTLQALLEENAQLKHVVAEYEQITRELEQQVEQLGRANTHLTH